MPVKLPIKGALYLHNSKVYRVATISRGTDEIILEDTSTGARSIVRFGLFEYGYQRVLKVKDVAGMLNRHPRSIYRYETMGLINKPIVYEDKRGRLVRYYRPEHVLDIHEMISLVHQGRPNKSKRVVNNSLPDITTLKEILRRKYG